MQTFSKVLRLVELFLIVFLFWSCTQESGPEFGHIDKKTVVSLHLGIKAQRSSGCLSCELMNKYQWNFLYKIFGGKEGIEFIVYCSNEKKREVEQNLSYDVLLIVDKNPETDELIVRHEGRTIFQKAGVLDMFSVRQITDLLIDSALKMNRFYKNKRTS